MKYTDVMVDLETLGRDRSAMILSIGYTFFNANGQETFDALLGRTYSAVVDMEQSKSGFFTIERETLGWWLSRAHQLSMMQAQPKTPLAVILEDFNERWKTHAANSNINIWANSPSFDCEILKHAFKEMRGHTTARVECPWQFWQERDVRTTLGICKIDKKRVMASLPNFLPHFADHDSAFQAYCVQQANIL